VGVRRKPVVAFDVFAVGFKAWEEILLVAFQNVGNGFAVSLDDFKVLVVDPNASLKIALIFFRFFLVSPRKRKC